MSATEQKPSNHHPFDPPAEVLIVDNDQSHAETVAESLGRVGFHCRVATSGKEGVRMIEDAPCDVVITDLVMNDIDGLGILERSKAGQPDAEVILMTGHGTVPSAVEAMRRGAFNYLLKPLEVAQLRANAEKAVESSRLKRTNVELKRRLDERFGFEGVIGDSPQMRDVIERLKRIAPTDASVLIQGETGTGKELVAQAIHQNSPRKNKPFVALNCAALSENILESELFGHVKGAFTDASADRVGKFEFAHGGTMFLDEVGDMPPATQIKLLRVLENGEITRVGSNTPVKVNVRILFGHQPRPGGGDHGGHLPQRPLPPAQSGHDPPAHAAAAEPGHPYPDRLFHPPVRRPARQADQGHVAGRTAETLGLRVAGQRPPTT